MEDLRIKVKMLKVLQDIKYTDLAKGLGIHSHSFYNWLKGYYEFSKEREYQLHEMIDKLTKKCGDK